jgi:hypothetical protein
MQARSNGTISLRGGSTMDTLRRDRSTASDRANTDGTDDPNAFAIADRQGDQKNMTQEL